MECAIRSLLVSAPALLLAGCISFGGKPLPSLMTLTPTVSAPAGQTLVAPATPSVVVLTPDVDRRLTTTRVPVRIDAERLAYLKGAAWVEMPAHLFQGLLVETIRGRGRFVVFDHDQPQAAIRLGGELDALDYDAQRHAVVVRFDAERFGKDHTVATRRFEATVSGVNSTPGEVAPALNRAANEVAVEVADWLGQ